MRKRNFWIALGLMASVLMASAAGYWGYTFIRDLNVWGFRKALPESAAVVKEEAWEDGFLPDYRYDLVARVSEPEFLAYTAKFNLKPVSKDGRVVYERVEGDESIEAWYENGCLHLHAFNH